MRRLMPAPLRCSSAARTHAARSANGPSMAALDSTKHHWLLIFLLIGHRMRLNLYEPHGDVHVPLPSDFHPLYSLLMNQCTRPRYCACVRNRSRAVDGVQNSRQWGLPSLFRIQRVSLTRDRRSSPSTFTKPAAPALSSAPLSEPAARRGALLGYWLLGRCPGGRAPRATDAVQA